MPLAVTRLLPGLLISVAITFLAMLVSELPFWPFSVAGNGHPIEPVMLAIILGIAFAAILAIPAVGRAAPVLSTAFPPGLKFASRKLLPIAIVLLGARLDFHQVIKVGGLGMAMSTGTILFAMALFGSFIAFGWVKLNLGILLGVGTAICGGTAIVATAPVIDADDQDVTFSVAVVTLLGLLAMFALPVIGHLAGMSDKAFGIWAGLSIHQTPQVVAAGMAYSAEAGNDATVVKLARVSLLAPVILAIGVFHSRLTGGKSSRKVGLLGLVPLFVLGFLAMALLRTMGTLNWIHPNLAHTCEIVSKFLIVVAMAAVGMETRLSALRRTGIAPLGLAAVASLLICIIGFALLRGVLPG